MHYSSCEFESDEVITKIKELVEEITSSGVESLISRNLCFYSTADRASTRFPFLVDEYTIHIASDDKDCRLVFCGDRIHSVMVYNEWSAMTPYGDGIKAPEALSVLRAMDEDLANREVFKPKDGVDGFNAFKKCIDLLSSPTTGFDSISIDGFKIDKVTVHFEWDDETKLVVSNGISQLSYLVPQHKSNMLLVAMYNRIVGECLTPDPLQMFLSL